jgi:hypothetical protein
MAGVPEPECLAIAGHKVDNRFSKQRHQVHCGDHSNIHAENIHCAGPPGPCLQHTANVQGKLEEWFGTVLTLGFVFVTYNILDMIFYAHMSGIVNDPAIIAGGTAHNNPTVTFAFDLAYLIAYIMVFWITSKYVGKGMQAGL